MKKTIKITGTIQDLVTYCTAVFELQDNEKIKDLPSLIENSPIFEDKNFYTNVQSTVQKTTVTRKTKIFIQGLKIIFQVRYEILKSVDISITEHDDEWVKNDINKLIDHLEMILALYDDNP